MKTVKAMIIILFLCMASARSQTIRIDDVDDFVGCYAINKAESGNGEIDCSKIIEWHIVRPINGLRRPGLDDINQSQNKHWIYRWSTLSKQEDRVYSELNIPPEISNLRFYVYYDFFGWEKQKNVLTVWRQTGRDSISYICGQMEEVETYVGSALIEDITLFPDSSLVLAIKLAGEDFENHKFIISRNICEFTELYHSGWTENYPDSGLSARNVVYDYSNLNYPYYQVVEIEKYITGGQHDFLGEYAYSRIDSVKSKILNLWEMAQK